LELVLGFIASYFMGTGLLFWIIGFGIGHILFGYYIHVKYDKRKAAAKHARWRALASVTSMAPCGTQTTEGYSLTQW
jgi:hypothetical protein